MQSTAVATHQTIRGQRRTLSNMNQNRFVYGGAVFLLVISYVAYTVHYSVNNLYSDDWTIVGYIDAALHHHLTLDQMWSTRGGGENRVLIPYLVIVGVGLR